jgi:hypothetical protein
MKEMKKKETVSLPLEKSYEYVLYYVQYEVPVHIPEDPGVSDLNPALEAGMVGEYLHGGLRVGVIGRLITTTST